MARISEQTIEQIRSIADIQDVVGRYVQLKKRGSNWFGLCPFHQEKTGSFAVNPSRQIYKCFGCGEGGGVIQFVRKIENLEFVDSLKFLAEMYNIDIQWEGKFSKEKADMTTEIYEMHELAEDHFCSLLKKSAKQMKYLQKERALNVDTIDQFKLGYSSDDWSKLLDLLRVKSYSANAMNESGLILSGKKGYFDRFRNRIMFPLINERGKTCGFAGRALDPDDPAKYMNSPESPIYHKSSFLYGLDQSKNAIQKQNKVLLVEGYLDFLQLFQSGFTAVAALSGTAFTLGHARKLKRYTENIYLVFDGDSAGSKAAVRSGYILLKQGIIPKILDMPENTDPDDMMVQGKQDEFKGLIETADDLLTFHHKQAVKKSDDSLSLNRFTDFVMQEISQNDDPVFRELQIRHLTELTEFREETLFEKLQLLRKGQAQRRPSIKSKRKEISVPEKSSGRLKCEEEIIQLCFVEEPKIRKFFYDHLKKEWFTNDVFRHIFENVFIHLHSSVAPDANVVMDSLDQKDRESLSLALFDLDRKQPTLRLAVDCLTHLETYILKDQLEEQRTNLKADNVNASEMESALKTISMIQEKIRKIKHKYS